MSQRSNFIDEIRRLTAVTDWLEAERMAREVLHAARPLLRSDERRVLASHLPPSLGGALATSAGEVDDSVDAFYRRVASRMQIPLPRAVEQARIVCALLASRLTQAERDRLVRDQPAPIADLFTRPLGKHAEPQRKSAEPVLAQTPPPSAGRTLASGRPGSSHPVSESRLDRAQTHSVARESNPHADSKISSARGLTQEQLRESLATGRPASSR